MCKKNFFKEQASFLNQADRALDIMECKRKKRKKNESFLVLSVFEDQLTIWLHTVIKDQ